MTKLHQFSDFTDKNIFVGRDIHLRSWNVSLEYNFIWQYIMLDPYPGLVRFLLSLHYLPVSNTPFAKTEGLDLFPSKYVIKYVAVRATWNLPDRLKNSCVHLL